MSLFIVIAPVVLSGCFSGLTLGFFSLLEIDTLTTVGYGDITPFGKLLERIIMIMGYGVIVVPIGIGTAEISGRVMNLKEIKMISCKSCNQAEHHTAAIYCHKCGHILSSNK